MTSLFVYFLTEKIRYEKLSHFGPNFAQCVALLVVLSAFSLKVTPRGASYLTDARNVDDGHEPKCHVVLHHMKP